MKRSAIIAFVLLALVAVAPLAPVSSQESLSAWPYFVDVNSQSDARGLSDFLVTAEVFGRAREDLADLRLYDRLQREIPYGLRVLRKVHESREVKAKEFNRSAVGNASELSADLGEGAGEHNEVEIDTEGDNFRRLVNLEGSDDGAEWRTIVSGAIIFRFESNTQSIESNRVSYPASRYRYLRVRVFADSLSDRAAPVINGVEALMVVRQEGELVTWNTGWIESRRTRHEGEAATAWIIDFGNRVPCSQLTLDVSEETFSRPYVVETADDPQNVLRVATGEITRPLGKKIAPVVIAFDENREVFVSKLRLIVTDYGNTSLSIESIKPAAAARQIVFDASDSVSAPLRLYFGNPKASAPRYDFEKNLPDLLKSKPVRYELGTVQPNPVFEPEPEPLTERLPWLIYLVLGASSLALAAILINLARRSIRDQAPPPDAEKAEEHGSDSERMKAEG
ncbi:MAG: DUF3999 domain-containing protein [Blastocatellia bacterium]|nr:DUF3999 domain-containing protein [Blastocatellia bacterium]